MDLKLLHFGRFTAPPVSPMLTAGLSQVRAYWEALRRDGAIPDRGQLDPRGLVGMLDRVFLAEGIGRGLVQVRIAGSALVEAAGMDLRGLPLSCLFAPEARPHLAAALQEVLDGQVLVELDLCLAPCATEPLARLALFPMTDQAKRQLVLGCIGCADGVLAARGKFTILRRHAERLAPRLASDPAKPTAPVGRRQAHLTLVSVRD